MSLKNRLQVVRITSPRLRELALKVLVRVYREEKGWTQDIEAFLPAEDLEREDVAWFGVLLDNRRMLGVTRLLYRIPMNLYHSYDFQLVDPGMDVEAFIRNNRIAEVGRFAVLPKYRRRFRVAAALMRTVGFDAMNRGFTHFITDVFEEDPNTPYGFHRRVLGFQVVATHEVGELNCKSRRVTMLLDLRAAQERLGHEKGWFWRFLNANCPEAAELTATQPILETAAS